MRIIPQLLSGDAGIYQTVQQMKQMINEASIDPVVRKQAYKATEYCDRDDHTCKCYAILAYAKNKINYVYDPTTFELLQHPKLFAKAINTGLKPYGDCDDFSMYIASLLKSIGLKPVLRIIGKYDKYHHVYVKCNGLLLDGTVESIREMKFTRGFDIPL